MSDSICGVWIDKEGRAHVSWRNAAGKSREEAAEFRPFLWLSDNPTDEAISGITIEDLKGDGPLSLLAHADSLEDFKGFLKVAKQSGWTDVLRPMEAQFLMQQKARLFAEMSFAEVRRCQLDIETDSEDEFSNTGLPKEPGLRYRHAEGVMGLCMRVGC